jgi:amino-acid N-acetyltransferase
MPDVRPAVAEDLSAIEELLRAAKLPTEGVAELLRGAPGAVVVAVEGGHVVAAGALEPAGNARLLRSVVVDARARSTGLGRAIIHRLLADADEAEVPEIYLLTTTADRWFPRFGFERTDRAAVPAAVGETWEFTTGCAQTAVAMMRVRPATRGAARP